MIKEFITLYYGKAAPMVEKYFNELENYLKKGAEKGIAGFYACNPIQLGYINKSNLKRWSDDFDKMDQLVKMIRQFFSESRLCAGRWTRPVWNLCSPPQKNGNN